MNTQFRSDNISLLLSGGYGGHYANANEIWQTFRRAAVEPCQASSTDFTSFADECLLCAEIVTNTPGSPNEDTHDWSESLWDAEERTQDTQISLAADTHPPPVSEHQRVGLIYLHSNPTSFPAGEANVGVITKPDVQRRGYAREAVHLVLRWAFEELKFHRVQAAILDTPFRDRALRLFVGCGFVHEGTKRRAVYQPEDEGMAGVWKDVTYLAMLDTEWTLKSMWMQANRAPEPPVVSVWDEMFARHAKEREELLRWEEKHGRVRKASSTETLRDHTKDAAQDIAYLTDDASSISGSSPPSPRPLVIVTCEEDACMSDADDLRQSWEEVVETSLAARRNRRWMVNSSPEPSFQGRMLALPSIPSFMPSEGNSQSPLTIPSPSTPRSCSPPYSSSPSPAPSSVHSTWPDTEDEDNLSSGADHAHTHVPMQFTTPPDPSPYPASPNSRRSSVSSCGTEAWSDAQSSVNGSSSSWDMISNASDRVPSVQCDL